MTAGAGPQIRVHQSSDTDYRRIVMHTQPGTEPIADGRQPNNP